MIDERQLQQLAQLEKVRPGLRAKLFMLYQTQFPVQMGILREALARQDQAAAASAAHTIKGSALNIGASHVGDLAKSIEQRLLAGSSPDMDEMLTALEAVYSQSVQEISRLIDPG